MNINIGIQQFFEDRDEIFFACDNDTNEILYMNKAARRAFGVGENQSLDGLLCYHVIQKSAGQCSICRKNGLVLGKALEWRVFHPWLKKEFLLNVTLLEENGRRYHVEIWHEINLDNNPSPLFDSRRNLEIIVNEALREALSAEDPNKSIEIGLEYIGKALDADRTYIFESAGDVLNNTYEWTKADVSAEKKDLQNIPASIADIWYEAFNQNQNIVTEDISVLKEKKPELYDLLSKQNIKSLIEIPIILDGNIIGFYGVDNPPSAAMEYSSELLQIMANFVVSAIKRRNLFRSLENMGFYSYNIATRLTSDYSFIAVIDVKAGDLNVYKAEKEGEITAALSEAKSFSEVSALIAAHAADREDWLKKSSFDSITEGIKKQTLYNVSVQTSSRKNPRTLQFTFADVAAPQRGKSYIFAMRDITETVINEVRRKELLEDALERAELANNAKTTFLSNMSHDIRTPMNAVMGFTALALKHLDDKEKTKDYLGKISSAGSNLLSLINNVLDMSRIESGRLNLNLTPGYIEAVISDVESILHERISEKKINYTHDLSALSKTRVLFDSLHLNQVLLNLIDNAIKYTPEGGSVSLSVREVPSVKSGFVRCEFTVTDTGIGISKDFLPHVFEPFAREHTTTVSGIQGSGLGLPIVKNIADMMGGKISVQSKPGKGSTFVLEAEFEICDARRDGDNAAAGSAREISPAEIAAGIKDGVILLVEDNELNREIAEEVLSDAGFRVDAAENGQEALRAVKASPDRYKLILMDIQMPVMDGYEATRRIRALRDKTASRIPIVAMSANAFDEDKRRSLDAGMNGHISKPVSAENLIAAAAGFMKSK